MRKQIIFLLLAFFFITCGIMPAQKNLIPLKNPGFEKSGGSGNAENWSVIAGSIVNLNNKVFYSGSQSLQMSHDQWNQSTILSEEINLKVGHVYKLSGWIKTENAYTDPIDQYPTPVAACLTMESFPFTNNSPSAGSTRDWQKIEVMFVATKAKDNVRLNFGYNGKAKGNVWFDDIELTEVTDISEYIPLETVKWYGPAFRYEDKGWIFVHIEGKPYQRGYQYGYLLADEIKLFIEKLAVNYNSSDPQGGWNRTKFQVDAMLLRKYDDEYLTEMKGIADGAAKNGAKVFDRPVDLLDIVAINSSIDLDYMQSALRVTPNPLTGKSFLSNEEELSIQERLHKCSAFLANNSATKDGRIVYGQIFMWGGYTGYHWNVIADVQPSEGNRLVYQTYPGGIHSGADFYMNSAGIMLGETTVQQTPFNPDGIPQSNRIRKAAQYANSIDDVVKIMTEKNNGMYTNDWLIGDVKRNEIGILLLGTYKWKLWRSSKQDWYGDAKDFYWSNNNNKDLEVRKEYIQNSDESPADIIWRPANRDIAFWNFYQEKKGEIDQHAAFDLWNSSPINRPHACDGKVTTSEMAENLMFFAHNGKVTLREQFVGENGRMPDLPNSVPRFTLGYTVANPVYVANRLKELKDKMPEQPTVKNLSNQFSDVKDVYSFSKEGLWKGTVYPAGSKENWFVSATSSYYNYLRQMPSSPQPAFNYSKDELTELNYRLLYNINKEGNLAPLNALTVYDRYNNYQIPRIKGTYLLHQLRLLLGNDTFSGLMNSIHNEFKEKNISNEQIIRIAEKSTGKKLNDFVMQWLEREDLPALTLSAETWQVDDLWKVKVNVKQDNKPYRFFTTIAIENGKERILKLIEVADADQSFDFLVREKPSAILFNYGNDVPVQRSNYYTSQNFFDDYANVRIIYGTSQQIEANHTIGLRYQKMVADRFTEVFQPLIKDSEISRDDLAVNDLIILGGPSENSFAADIFKKLGLECGKYFFKWNGQLYNNNDDGLYLTYPNPYNPAKTIYIFIGNSAQQLYQMTKAHQTMPAWALFKGAGIVKRGYYPVDQFEIKL
ncbi:MAG TPA: C45 family autoproteolytic acyltransferase/hydrolase [Melioribacteraceae bacterium]|nr:C45 family autoproteolytic acyltransferase/hydrolase [Melioribacteraceae bacterium]